MIQVFPLLTDVQQFLRVEERCIVALSNILRRQYWILLKPADPGFRLSEDKYWFYHLLAVLCWATCITCVWTTVICIKEAVRVLIIANTLFQQHKRQLYTWISPDDQYWNQTDYILCSWRWRSSIQSAKTRPRADCGSDYELLIAKFRLKLKKVGKTTRSFRYD